MKKKVFGMTMVLGAALVAAAPLYALAGGSRVRMDVPFAFSAGGESLPAGEYTIQKGSATHYLIRDRDREVRATVFVMRGIGGADAATVTFRRYGHRSFLASVAAPGFGAAELRPSADERQLQAELAAEARYRIDVEATVEP